jgi:hypothetical protein
MGYRCYPDLDRPRMGLQAGGLGPMSLAGCLVRIVGLGAPGKRPGLTEVRDEHLER